jgi:integrase/recombinase XerD
MDLYDTIHGYLDYLRIEKQMAANTVEAYERDLIRFAAFLEQAAVADPLLVNHQHILDYIQVLHDNLLTSSSISRNLSAIRGCFHFLIAEGHCESDPTATVSVPKPWMHLPEVLTVEDVERLLQQPDLESPNGLRDRALLELLYATGMRVSELVNLHCQDLFLWMSLCESLARGARSVCAGFRNRFAHDPSLPEHERERLPVLTSQDVLFLNRLAPR